MYVFDLSVYLCISCMSDAYSGQEELDSLELELQIVGNYQVGART